MGEKKKIVARGKNINARNKMDKFITLELNVAAILCDLIDTVLRRSLRRVFKSERIFKLSNQKKKKNYCT